MREALATGQVTSERRPGANLDATSTGARRRLAGPSSRGTRAYRPCLLWWVRGTPSDALIELMRRAARDWDRRTLLVSVDSGAQALLVPEDSSGRVSRDRLDVLVRSVVQAVQAVRPRAEICAVVGDRITSRERVPVVAERLHRLARFARARGGDEVIWARRYSLASLLETVDPRQASAFVEGQLSTLRAYDREHSTNLQRVLELALDHENRNTAARAAFMHRNTFRRQLARALELIDVDLSCPEERLALHIALKLRSPAAPSIRRR